jgi:hypothetical protein
VEESLRQWTTEAKELVVKVSMNINSINMDANEKCEFSRHFFRGR